MRFAVVLGVAAAIWRSSVMKSPPDHPLRRLDRNGDPLATGQRDEEVKDMARCGAVGAAIADRQRLFEDVMDIGRSSVRHRKRYSSMLSNWMTRGRSKAGSLAIMLSRRLALERRAHQSRLAQLGSGAR